MLEGGLSGQQSADAKIVQVSLLPIAAGLPGAEVRRYARELEGFGEQAAGLRCS